MVWNPLQGEAQSDEASDEPQWYLSWGYNRSSYQTSDLHLWGTGPSGSFDLTFEAAAAADMPEPFDPKVYFNPTLFTIPQFDVRFGRRIAERRWLSFGWDHMKYKLTDQWMTVTGVAAAGDLALTSTEDVDLNGTLPNQSVQLEGAGLWWGDGYNYEHSDGLNFVRVGLEQASELLHTAKHPETWVDVFGALSAGFAVCSTDFRWAGERTKNAQHVSGYGASGLLGARFHAGPHVFLQVTAQSGAIRLPWVVIQGAGEAAGASQVIRYNERAFALGYRFG